MKQIMKGIGLGLLIAGALTALIAGFGDHGIGWLVGGIVFAVIGIIAMILA